MSHTGARWQAWQQSPLLQFAVNGVCAFWFNVLATNHQTEAVLQLI